MFGDGSSPDSPSSLVEFAGGINGRHPRHTRSRPSGCHRLVDIHGLPRLKLLGTSATLLGTSALLVVTRS